MYTPSYPSRYFTLPTLAVPINIMFIFLSLFLFISLSLLLSLSLPLFLFLLYLYHYPLISISTSISISILIFYKIKSLFLSLSFGLFLLFIFYSLLYTGVEPVLLDWKAKVLDRWTNRAVAVTVKTTVPYINIPSYSPTSHLALYPLFLQLTLSAFGW